MIRPLAALACVGLIAACSSSGPRSSVSRTVADRVLNSTPSPGAIVAVESEFAQAARNDGQWTAFRRFAAEDGVVHGRNGPVNAVAYFSALTDPDEAVQWGARSVWTSCRGDLAVSQGRFEQPSGLVGTYVTVWKRQPDRTYRYVYDFGAPDDPQPPPRKPDEPSEGEIVVSALTSIRGVVADCPEAGSPAAPRDASAQNGSRTGGGLSSDGSLTWQWSHLSDGTRIFTASYFEDGQWTQALEQSVAARSE